MTQVEERDDMSCNFSEANSAKRPGFTPNFQREILSLVMTNEPFMLETIDFLSPKYFEDVAHELACAVCQEHFRERGHLLGETAILHELASRHGRSKQLPRYLAEIEHAFYIKEESWMNKDSHLQEVRRFAKRQAYRTSMVKQLDLLESEKYDEIPPLLQATEEMFSSQERYGLDIIQD